MALHTAVHFDASKPTNNSSAECNLLKFSLGVAKSSKVNFNGSRNGRQPAQVNNRQRHVEAAPMDLRIVVHRHLFNLC